MVLGGEFPLWLTPDQVAILPISEKYADYAQELYKILESEDITGFVDKAPFSALSLRSQPVVKFTRILKAGWYDPVTVPVDMSGARVDIGRGQPLAQIPD